MRSKVPIYCRNPMNKRHILKYSSNHEICNQILWERATNRCAALSTRSAGDVIDWKKRIETHTDTNNLGIRLLTKLLSLYWMLETFISCSTTIWYLVGNFDLEHCTHTHARTQAHCTHWDGTVAWIYCMFWHKQNHPITQSKPRMWK